MENAVLYAVENNIATITLNRPSSLNSMNDALIDGIHEALDKVQADAEVKCVVRNFCYAVRNFVGAGNSLGNPDQLCFFFVEQYAAVIREIIRIVRVYRNGGQFVAVKSGGADVTYTGGNLKCSGK